MYCIKGRVGALDERRSSASRPSADLRYVGVQGHRHIPNPDQLEITPLLLRGSCGTLEPGKSRREGPTGRAATGAYAEIATSWCPAVRLKPAGLEPPECRDVRRGLPRKWRLHPTAALHPRRSPASRRSVAPTAPGIRAIPSALGGARRITRPAPRSVRRFQRHVRQRRCVTSGTTARGPPPSAVFSRRSGVSARGGPARWWACPSP